MYTIGHYSSFSVKITPAKLLKETTAETKMLMQKKYVPEVWMETRFLVHTLRLNLCNNQHSVSQQKMSSSHYPPTRFLNSLRMTMYCTYCTVLLNNICEILLFVICLLLTPVNMISCFQSSFV
jgi:hypothetical protein